jgi:gas vesicle protein
VVSRGQDITIQTLGQSQVIDARAYQLKLGNGSQNVNLEAGGDVLVSDLPMGNKRVAEKSSKISEKWQRMDDRISARMRNTFDEVDRKIEQAERVTKEAQATLEKAGKRIQAAMEDLGRRSPEGWVNIPESVIFIPPIPSINTEAIKITIPTIKFPQGPHPAVVEEKTHEDVVKTPLTQEPEESQTDLGVSDEERLLILRMLQEKKINVDQAEELLRALEGQDEE